MPTEVQITENVATLICTDELTIAQVAAFKDIITGLPPEVAEVEVDLENVSDMDLASLQIFCSANRTFERNQKRMIFKGLRTDLVEQTLQECGYDGTNGCPDSPCENCFWKGLED